MATAVRPPLISLMLKKIQLTARLELARRSAQPVEPMPGEIGIEIEGGIYKGNRLGSLELKVPENAKGTVMIESI